MFNTFVFLCCIAVIAADTIIDHSSGGPGASALPAAPGNYKMIFNPQTGKTEFIKISGDTSATSSAGASGTGVSSSGSISASSSSSGNSAKASASSATGTSGTPFGIQTVGTGVGTVISSAPVMQASAQSVTGKSLGRISSSMSLDAPKQVAPSVSSSASSTSTPQLSKVDDFIGSRDGNGFLISQTGVVQPSTISTGRIPLPRQPGAFQVVPNTSGQVSLVPATSSSNNTGSIQLLPSTQEIKGPATHVQLTSANGGKNELFINGQKVEIPANGTITHTDPITGITRTITHQTVGTAQAAPAQSMDIGGGATIREEANGDAFVTHNGQEQQIPKNGTITIKDPVTGETRTITRTVTSTGNSSSVQTSTVVKTQAAPMPGQGPLVPIKVGNETLMAPEGTTFVTDEQSGHTTFNIPLKANFPDCGYSLHTGGADGPVVSNFLATPTDVTHVWSCKYDESTPKANQTLSCLSVHSCTATFGDGRSEKLIDEKGCSTNTTKIPQPQFLDDLRIVTTTRSDLSSGTGSVHLACNIRQNLKRSDGCQRPKC